MSTRPALQCVDIQRAVNMAVLNACFKEWVKHKQIYKVLIDSWLKNPLRLTSGLVIDSHRQDVA